MLKDKPCTKRGILSTITSIFGTLGFVAPILLEGNKILQELCKENTCWDEPVSDAIKQNGRNGDRTFTTYKNKWQW